MSQSVKGAVDASNSGCRDRAPLSARDSSASSTSPTLAVPITYRSGAQSDGGTVQEHSTVLLYVRCECQMCHASVRVRACLCCPSRTRARWFSMLPLEWLRTQCSHPLKTGCARADHSKPIDPPANGHRCWPADQVLGASPGQRGVLGGQQNWRLAGNIAQDLAVREASATARRLCALALGAQRRVRLGRAARRAVSWQRAEGGEGTCRPSGAKAGVQPRLCRTCVWPHARQPAGCRRTPPWQSDR